MELEDKLGITQPSSAEPSISHTDQQIDLARHEPTSNVIPDIEGCPEGVRVYEHAETTRHNTIETTTRTTQQREQYPLPSPKSEPVDLARLFRPFSEGSNTIYMTSSYKPRSLTIAPGSIYADRIYTTRDGRPKLRDWTPKKLLNVETAVAQMTTRMLMHIAKLSPDAADPKSQTARHLRDYKLNLRVLHERLKLIKALRDAQDPECLGRMQYPRYDGPMQGDRIWANDLNRSLQELLDRHSRRSLSDEQVISRIVYNLMISKQAPDNRTFTTLISYFSRIGQHNLAGIVVNGLDSSNIREDEMSVNAVLTHYVRSRNRTGFLRFAERMRGLHGGLFLAHPKSRIGRGTNIRRTKEHGNVQCIEEDGPIFTSLINGYLVFGKFASAMQTYWKMIEKGFEPDTRVFGSFLHFFSRAAKKDKNLDELWEKGSAAWKALKALRKTDSLAVDRSFMAAAYANMLALCQSCHRPHEYSQISRERLAEDFRRKETPWFRVDMRISRSRQRKLREIENMLLRVEEDLRTATARVVALKTFWAGDSLLRVQDAFRQASDGPAHQPWWQETWSSTEVDRDSKNVAVAGNTTVAEIIAEEKISTNIKEEVKETTHPTLVHANGRPDTSPPQVAWRQHTIPTHIGPQQWAASDLQFAVA